MMKTRSGCVLWAVLPALLIFFLGCRTAPEVNFGSLLEEMVDRDERARYPEPYYATLQFSSYDRASVAAGDPSWFANWDRSMFIREDLRNGRREYVMFDAEGPGAVVRFWMTFAGEKAGEGILRIYFDGEDFPSHFGTGTEDYYGYAWCRPEVFTNHPFISQPDGSGNFWPGYTVNMRYRGLDDIPFRTELRVDMEMWHWGTTRINFAPACFFYLLPGAECALGEDKAGIRAPVALERSHIIPKWISGGLMEGENMVLDSVSGGRIGYQYGEDWSNGLRLWWRDGKPGDTLVKTFHAEEAGTYDVEAVLTRAPDYGKVSIALNGRPFIPVFDGYHKDGVTTAAVKAGRQTINKGENTLRITITGKSPVDDKAFFGLDVLKFE